MQTYIAIVHKEDDTAFGLTFPDVPGCFSAADTESEILPNAIEALNLHLEETDHPAPRGIDAIASDPEVAADLRDGAYLLAVPLVTTQNRVVRVNLSFDKGMVDAIDTAANQRGLTRSAFLAESARNEIEGRH